MHQRRFENSKGGPRRVFECPLPECPFIAMSTMALKVLFNMIIKRQRQRQRHQQRPRQTQRQIQRLGVHIIQVHNDVKHVEKDLKKELEHAPG